MYRITKFDKVKRVTASDIIRQCLLEGNNSIQIFLKVKNMFPTYEDRKLRKLISVIKSKYYIK